MIDELNRDIANWLAKRKGAIFAVAAILVICAILYWQFGGE